MDPVLRHQLCRLLDKPNTGSDWIVLASALNLGPVVMSIMELEKEKSPTDCLLDNYSVSLKSALNCGAGNYRIIFSAFVERSEGCVPLCRALVVTMLLKSSAVNKTASKMLKPSNQNR